MTTDSFREKATSTSQFAAPLAAGRYWVGDPCYAFTDRPHEDWMAWLEDAWKDVDANKVRILDGRFQGRRIVASGTAYGDGFYDGTDGNAYGVDAGLIGVVHADFFPELMKGIDVAEGLPVVGEFGMVLHEFPEPFHVSYEPETGDITIGHVTVHTGQPDWMGGDEDEEAEEDPWS